MFGCDRWEEAILVFCFNECGLTIFAVPQVEEVEIRIRLAERERYEAPMLSGSSVGWGHYYRLLGCVDRSVL